MMVKRGWLIDFVPLYFSTDVLKQEKHVLFPVLTPYYPQNVIFTIFAPVSCHNVFKIKMNKKSLCCELAGEDIAANRTYLSKNLIA